MNSATTNTVRITKGSKQIAFRVTRHGDGRVTAERSSGVVWRPIGGLKAARSQMDAARAEGFEVVAAA